MFLRPKLYHSENVWRVSWLLFLDLFEMAIILGFADERLLFQYKLSLGRFIDKDLEFILAAKHFIIGEKEVCILRGLCNAHL